MTTLFVFFGISALIVGIVIFCSVYGKKRAERAEKGYGKRSAKPAKKAKKKAAKPAAVKKSEGVKAEKVEEAVSPAPVASEEPTEKVRSEAADNFEPAADLPAADDDGGDEAEEQSERKLVVENGEVKYIIIKYSKSFQAKLIQSDEVTKGYYSQLKNSLLSYKGVKSRISWRWETFRLGRKTLAKLRMRGKTLSLALALNPDDFADSKYVVESVADVAAYADTPCLYKMKNDRRVKYAKELIDKVMQGSGLSAGLVEESVDYVSRYPYETTEALLERGLIKELTDEEAQSGTVFKPSDVRQSVTAAEVDRIMQDEVAEILIEKAEGVSDRTRVGIVNIDMLSRTFSDGEEVTLEEVKKRVAGFDKKVTYLKVLARGALDKKLTVTADAFSLQAAKMILLTGGKVIKK